HDANAAGKGRDVEAHLGVAVRPDRNDAGIERERRLRRRAGLERAAAVAAGAHLPDIALHAVDELAVQVADLGRELALAELVIVRRRRLVAGEVENADVDGGNHDARLLAGAQAIHLNGYAQRAARPQQIRKLQVERKGLRLAVDREPLHPDGAAGHAARLGIE